MSIGKWLKLERDWNDNEPQESELCVCVPVFYSLNEHTAKATNFV